MSKFWNFAETEECYELFFTEPIAADDDWFAEDSMTPKSFRDELNKCGGKKIKLRISSPGGDCTAASEIYTDIKAYPGEVTAQIDGIAASAASVIAMAADKVVMAPTALMMIHDPMTCAWGNTSEMKKAIKTLDEVKESILNAYELKTGLARDKLSKLMSEETWMSAYKARDLGFCDEVLGGDSAVYNSYSFTVQKPEKTASAKEVDDSAVSTETLKKRLELLKYI